MADSPHGAPPVWQPPKAVLREINFENVPAKNVGNGTQAVPYKNSLSFVYVDEVFSQN